MAAGRMWVMLIHVCSRSAGDPAVPFVLRGWRVRSGGICKLGALPVVLHLLAACGSDTPTLPPPSPPPPEPEPIPAIAIPAFGTAAALEAGTWNLLHFGAANLGPADEALQRARARDVILGTDADVWGVQEITRSEAFAQLLAQLPGYGGILVSDEGVAGGAEMYHAGELKVGLIYKTAVVQPLQARVILADLDHAFAGRPPLEVTARITIAGRVVDVVLIVLHAKARSDTASWTRRATAAAGLKDYLETTWPDAPVLVPGDWNDDVDVSITRGRDTPYRLFVDAAPDWRFPTAALSMAGATSILGYSDVIDHILASDEAMAWYEEGSALVHRVDSLIPEYRETTSDHLPVLVRFRLDGG